MSRQHVVVNFPNVVDLTFPVYRLMFCSLGEFSDGSGSCRKNSICATFLTSVKRLNAPT